MKITIVVPFFLFSFLSSFAQQQPKTLLEILKHTNTVTNSNNSGWNCRPGRFDSKKKQISGASLKNITTTGNLIALPQDNMPCLVPRQATAAVIPNAAKFSSPGNPIPNASRVHPVIPKH